MKIGFPYFLPFLTFVQEYYLVAMDVLTVLRFPSMFLGDFDYSVAFVPDST